MTINKTKLLTRIFSGIIAFVFLQSMFFKFSGAPETQYIFNTLNDWAANTFGIDGLFATTGIFSPYVIATAELIASLLLIGGLFTRHKILTPLGALMAFGVISGAITFHLFTPLGINVQGDGGMLFMMACAVWISAAGLLIMHKETLLSLKK